MPVFETKALLKALKTDTERNIGLVSHNFLNLDTKALNWKSNPEKWSIAECLEHLNIYSNFYLSAIETAIENGKTKQSEGQAQFSAGWLGNYFAETMKVSSDGSLKSKMKALKDYNPANSALDATLVLKAFLAHQQKTLDLLDTAESVDLGKLRVPTSITRFVSMKLGDALRFVIYHNTRHVVQASNVLKDLKKETK
jgi:uncharacterized damage-inducible protein DinB